MPSCTTTRTDLYSPLPELGVLGVEVLNPVHFSREGMGDTATPEAKFGGKLTFGRAGDGPPEP